MTQNHPSRIRKFQSTSPRGGRHSTSRHLLSLMYISIHVPARGTTISDTRTAKRRLISIHVPARGTTPKSGSCQFLQIDFNPRPREGDDERDRCMLIDGYRISIHVPARGTTCRLYSFRFWHSYFNPRPREGDDFTGFWGKYFVWLFQSTSPRGGRRT